MQYVTAGRNAFPSTHWTLVVDAGGNHSGLERAGALEHLCSGYWPPVYSFIRRRGYSPEQAQDLTQEFFLRILDGAFFERANPEKADFEAFCSVPSKTSFPTQTTGKSLKNAAVG